MQTADAAIVAGLSRELGYPLTAELVTQRIALLGAQAAHQLYVVEHPLKGLIGWVHVYAVQPFQADQYAEIGGLVVATLSRRTGAGKALMRAAEVWASEHGYASMRLRSGMHRPEAHLFYAAIGYDALRESMMFRKMLLK